MFCFAARVCALLMLSVATLVARDSDALKTHTHAAAASLGTAQLNALSAITDDRRRLLALTYYLRAGPTIAARWSWTSAEIEAYERSTEFRDVRAEVEKVAARFARDNPGFTLYANTAVRSLEEQIERWLQVNSVGVAADELHRATIAELSRRYPLAPTAESIENFRRFLVTWRASRPPTLAAPGLSLHGRGRAYDFQIRDPRGRIVAGADAATVDTVWDKQGWSAKLQHAVHAASDKFIGPLATPREPWHYEYRPL